MQSASLRNPSGQRGGMNRTWSADAIRTMDPPEYGGAGMAVDVRAAVLSNMSKHRGLGYGAAEQPQAQPAAAPPRPAAAATPVAAGVVLECKHRGCSAKLVIGGGGKEKQVIGSHTHALCQRGCWTCKNFVDAYLAYNGL